MLARLNPLLQKLDSDVLARRSIFVAVVLLMAWSALGFQFHQKSLEALVSSGRLLIETSLVLGLLLLLPRFNIPLLAFRAIVVLATINSIVVLFQLLEGTHCISTNFSWIINDFWRLPVDEYTRKPGLFNGVLTSSLVSFAALSLMAKRKDFLSLAVMAFITIPILFGARSFMIFLPFFLIVYWRVLASMFVVLGVLAAVNYSCNFNQMVEKHVVERYVPTLTVLTNANPDLDYSTKDLVTQYRKPETSNVWLIGNGEPRFSEAGGKDPPISRWLLQAGAPAAVLVLFISLVICWRIFRKGSWGQVVFAGALGVSIIKGELITSAVIYTVLLIYALSPREARLTPHVQQTLPQPVTT